MQLKKTERKYLSIDDIQREYLPISKKRIRMFVRELLPVKRIGGRMYVERSLLDSVLTRYDGGKDE